MENIILVILAASGFWTVVNTIVVYQISKKEKKDETKTISKKEFDAVCQGVRGLLYAELERQCTAYINDGHISASNLNDLRKYFYDVYVKLDGDGTIRALFERVENLPLN